MFRIFLQLLFFFITHNCLAQGIFPIKQNQKWGLINAKGQVITTPKYDAVEIAETFNYAVVQHNGKIGMLDASGKVLIPTTYDDLKVLNAHVVESLNSGEWKLMDLNEKILLENYERAQNLGEYIRFEQNDKWGLIDRTGNLIAAAKYEQILLKEHYVQTRNEGKLGAISYKGQVLINPQANRIEVANGNTFFYQVAELWGAVNENGRVLFEPQFEKYQQLDANFVKLSLANKSRAFSLESQQILAGVYDDFLAFSKDYLLIQRTAKVGLIHKNGQIIFPPKYYFIQAFGRGLFRVNFNNRWGIIDLQEQAIVPLQYQFISPIRNKTALVVQAGLFGLMNAQGKLILPCEYTKIERTDGQVRAFFGENMQTFELDAAGNLSNSDEYESHISFKIRGQEEKPSSAAVIEEQTQLQNFEWFYSPEAQRWGLRQLSDGSTAIEPKFDFIQVEKDFGFTLVGITKYSKLSFNRTTYRFDTAFGVVNNEIGKLVTKIQFLDIRVEDFQKGYPLARCIFLNGRHGLIARNGSIVQEDLVYIGEFQNSVAQVSTYGKLSATLTQDGLEKLDNYLSNMKSGHVMLDYTLQDQALEEKGMLSCENCTWGYINAAGKYIVEPRFSTAQVFKNKLGIVEKDDKWGVVNHKDKMMIPCKYSAVEYLKNTDESIIRVFNATPRYGVIDTLGTLKVDAIYEEVGKYSEEKLAIKQANKWGYVRTDGTQIIACKFREARAFSEGLAAVKIENRWGFIDERGEMVIRPQFIRVGNFKEGLAWAYNSQGIGYISKDGTWKIEPQFDKASSFFKGSARIAIDGKFGLINSSGDFLVRPRFTQINPFNELGLAVVRYGEERVRYGVINIKGELITEQAYRAVYPYSEGLAIVKTKEGLGYINAQGKLVIAPQYSKASNFSSGRAAVQKDGVCGYINRFGTAVVDFEYSKCLDFEGERAVVYKGYRKAGVLDVEGEYVIEPSLDRLLGFDEGRGLMRDRQYRFYYITESTEVYDGYYQEARRFQNGVAVVRLGDKWGIINQKGINIIPPKYDKIEDFENGYARVRVKGFYGLTNLKGKFIVPPTFEQVSYAGEGIFRVERGNDLGYINTDGNWVWRIDQN